jgi:hypothetical protein
MAKKKAAKTESVPAAGRPSAILDTRVIYCGDNLEQLKKLPDGCVDLIYIDPPFNSNRNYEVFWGETKEKRSFDDRHASTQAYIEFMRPRCVELHRVLKKTGSFYFHSDWHASHYVKVMLDQILLDKSRTMHSTIIRRVLCLAEECEWLCVDLKPSISVFLLRDNNEFQLVGLLISSQRTCRWGKQVI